MGSPSNFAEHTERDAAGHVTRQFEASPGAAPYAFTGRERTWTYRPDGLVRAATMHGVTRTMTYDDLIGTRNELGWTDTLGRSMAYTHDAAGNVASASDGTATTFSVFDLANRVTETRDALGSRTTYTYTEVGCGCSRDNLVTSIHTPDLPAGVAWQMSYDPEGRLASSTDP